MKDIIITVGIVFLVMFILCRIKQRALKKIINQDGLTLLLSEKKFLEDAKIILSKAVSNEYMLISIDIDKFKIINEIYGYDKGTELLVEVAKNITKYFVEADLKARVIADKFLILIKTEIYKKNYCEKGSICNYIKNVQKNILNEEFSLNMSQGIYTIYDTKLSLNYMIDCVNSARIDGKKIYGNKTVIFDKGMQKKRELYNFIISNMEQALIHEKFKIHYQPKVDLKSKELVGFEALVRWVGDDGKIIVPDKFIPIFETNEFISKLDYYIFDKVCMFISKNFSEYNIPRISVNLSGITILKSDVVNNLVKILESYGLDTKAIELEITESAMIENFKNLVNKVSKLREMGFIISMDDFGSGLSSLSRLKDIHFDIIKIDRLFIENTLESERGIYIIENIIKVSKHLDVITVAEGIETEKQADLLKKLGCDIAQGYYFSKPMPEENVIKYFLEYEKTCLCV
ncbi:MAG: EAL domain-containing protein [Proteocatella sp.]